LNQLGTGKGSVFQSFLKNTYYCTLSMEEVCINRFTQTSFLHVSKFFQTVKDINIENSISYRVWLQESNFDVNTKVGKAKLKLRFEILKNKTRIRKLILC